MPRHPNIPGWVVLPGWQGPAVVRRQVAVTDLAWLVSTAVPGAQRAPGPVQVSCVRNVETPSGSAAQARVCAGGAV